ncbi:MAG: hypothetical protein IKH45_03495 [Neisseriaceae bacterium]|nr:hypothetical protein [Neisseriaceae bacterium]
MPLGKTNAAGVFNDNAKMLSGSLNLILRVIARFELSFKSWQSSFAVRQNKRRKAFLTTMQKCFQAA